jgi:hypothetical protein
LSKVSDNKNKSRNSAKTCSSSKRRDYIQSLENRLKEVEELIQQQIRKREQSISLPNKKSLANSNELQCRVNAVSDFNSPNLGRMTHHEENGSQKKLRDEMHTLYAPEDLALVLPSRALGDEYSRAHLRDNLDDSQSNLPESRSVSTLGKNRCVLVLWQKF